MRPYQLGANGASPAGAAGDLIARACRGDEEAFRLIFEQHHRPVLRFIYAMVGEPGLAEELTQETFLQAYRSLASFKNEGKLATWLCGIAKNVVRRSLRSRRRERARVDIEDRSLTNLADTSGSAADEQLLGEELKRAVRGALAGLKEKHRLVFILKVLQQHSYEETALITGLSVPAVKINVHRARAEMRKRIRPFLRGTE